MEDLELKTLLAAYNQRLEEAKVLNLQSWFLNVKCFEDLQKQKAKSKLKSLITFKLFAIALGFLWILFLGNIFYFLLQTSRIFFTISVGVIFIINLAAIIVYVNHIVEISKINNSENVMKAQEQIARLKLSTLKIMRILFLQTPFFCTFWWNTKMIANNPQAFWLISFPIALLFTFASIWLYKNISLKNADKKWFRILFNSPDWKSLVRANGFLHEIETFKKNL
jgi:hypothetical protein